MTRLAILEVPHPLLKKPAARVETVDAALLRQMDDMLETMYDAPGIGLAAPQIGRSERVVVVDVSEDKDEPLRLINPEIVWRSDGRTIAEEGCLSLPKIFADIERASAVRVAYRDQDWKERTIEAEDILARCLQHEIDHLNGVLFTDHLSALKRNMLLRKLAKQRKVSA